ncbi:Nucleolar protein 9 [Mactra antiquata]
MERSKKNKKKPKESNDDTVNYYKRIEGVLQSQIENTTGENALSQADFVDNVFSQLLGEAVTVCQRAEISPIIEKLVTVGSGTNICDLLTIFSEDWGNICEDRCSSHVLQKVLLVAPKFINKRINNFNFDEISEISENDSTEDTLIKLVLGLYEFLCANIEASISHTQVSHILRALLQVIGGTCAGEKVLKSRSVRNYNKKFNNEDREETSLSREVKFDNYSVPVYFRKLLKRVYKSMFALENCGLYLTDANASPVLQTLLLVIHKVDIDLCQRVIHKIIKLSRIQDTPESVNIPPVVVDSVGSFLIELVVSLCSEKLYIELYQKLFKGKILQFATHPSANYVLQKLIKSCPDDELFSSCLAELEDCMGDVMEAQYFGVLVAISETCKVRKCEQEQFIQILMKSLNCEEEDRHCKFVSLVSCLLPYDLFMTMNECKLKKINYHGSLLLQNILKFDNMKYVTASLETLEPMEVVSWSCDPCGSHVIDAAFQSSSLKEKTKDMLLKKLMDDLVTIACDRNGSRTLESIWKCISMKQKVDMATCLCKQEEKIRSDRFGFHVHRNLALFHFSKRRNDWNHIQQNSLKKRKIFQDFLDTDEPSQTKKKKKSKKKTEL